jgi:hypothetical protein
MNHEEAAMGKTAIYQHTVVRPGSRIELAAPPGLREGDELDVLLLTNPGADDASERRSLLEILDSLPANAGLFRSAKDVDEYVRTERESWEPL